MKKFHDHSCYKYLKIPFIFFKQKLKYFKNIFMNMKINPQIFQVACNYIRTDKGLQFPHTTDSQFFQVACNYIKTDKGLQFPHSTDPQSFQVACNYIKTDKGLQFPHSTDPQILRWLAITLRLTRGYNFHTELTHQFCRLFDFDTYQYHPSVRPCPQA